MNRAGLLAAGAVVATAAAVAVEATTFDVAFPTDPLGPKAFPLAAAFLLAIGGCALLFEGWRGTEAGADAGEGVDEGVGAPSRALAPGPHPPAPPRPGPTLAAAASFVAYTLLLGPLGFVLATTLEFGALARIFGGSLARGTAAGLAFALVLYGLFVYGLGLPLPLGVLER